MLKTDRFYLAVALMTAAAVGCGGTEATGSGGSTSSSGSTGHGGGTSASSGSGSGSSSSSGIATCMSGQGPVFAINKLYFGDTSVKDPNTQDANAWKAFGFDLDGVASTPATPGAVCKPVAGANANSVNTDGDSGADNSFGENVLPAFASITKALGQPSIPQQANSSIASGTFTAMMKLECLPPMGDISPLLTKLYVGAPLGAPPKFDGTEAWPIAPESLNDVKDIESSKIVFGTSSVKGQAFDSGKNNTFILTVPLNTANGSTSITLTVHNARVIMTLDAARASATGGMIGGVLNTQEFLDQISKALNTLKYCFAYDGLAKSISQASDILKDGTQDPAKTCDGISIGVGFDMKPVKLGAVGMPTVGGTACP